MIPPNKFEMMWNIWGEILVLNSLIVLLQIDENVMNKLLQKNANRENCLSAFPVI